MLAPLQELGEQEYTKRFVPHGCDLQPFNAEGFDKCMADRRLIIIGDSLMRQTFQSLACLLSEVSAYSTSTGRTPVWF